jgi:hypothetical protein
LGKTIVDGGLSWTLHRSTQAPPPYGTIRDLRNDADDLPGVSMSAIRLTTRSPRRDMTKADLSAAEEDSPLRYAA